MNKTTITDLIHSISHNWQEWQTYSFNDFIISLN